MSGRSTEMLLLALRYVLISDAKFHRNEKFNKDALISHAKSISVGLSTRNENVV